ncbi:MAG: hypothetical protein LBE95_00255 [Holosporaceae bacterium]|jgi:hypothetical protein|nr:hypothetical protein [Holosporaceae bacterium]
MNLNKRITILAIVAFSTIMSQQNQAMEIVPPGELAILPRPKKISGLTIAAAETVVQIASVQGVIKNLFAEGITLHPLDQQNIDSITVFFTDQPPGWDTLGEGALVATQLNSLIKEKTFQRLYGNNDEWKDKLIIGTRKMTQLAYFVQYILETTPPQDLWNYMKVTNKILDEFRPGTVSQRLPSARQFEASIGIPLQVRRDLVEMDYSIRQAVFNREPQELQLKQFTPFM